MVRVPVRPPAQPGDFRVVFDGQSLNIAPLDFSILGWSYPWHLMHGRNIPWSRVAISGTSWTTLATTAATRLHPQAHTAATTILIMCGGTADVTSGDDGQTMYDEEVAYAAAARAAGFDYVISTTLVGHIGMNASQHTEREARNTLMLADPDGAFDAVADFDNSPLSDWTNTAYYFDGVHWYDPGAVLAAQIMAPVLDGILSP